MPAPLQLLLSPVGGQTESDFLARLDGSAYAAFEAVSGRTDLELAPAGLLSLLLDPVDGSTVVTGIETTGQRVLLLGPVDGSTNVVLNVAADLSDNPPMTMSMTFIGSYACRLVEG